MPVMKVRSKYHFLDWYTGMGNEFPDPEEIADYDDEKDFNDDLRELRSERGWQIVVDLDGLVLAAETAGKRNFLMWRDP